MITANPFVLKLWGLLLMMGALLILPVPVWAGQARSQPLVFAGAGTNLALTRILAEAFKRTRPDVMIQIAGSIESTGGIRAAADGAITVGLISRPLKDTEKGLGLTVLPYARTAAVLAGHMTVPDDGLSSEELVEIYRGKRTHWSDGSEIVVLTRDPGDGAIEILGREIPGFTAAYQESQRAKRWITLLTAQEMNRALVRTPYALGITDTGTVIAEHLPIKMLKLNGIAPEPESVRSGRYPLVRLLAFVYLKDRLPAEARSFLEFVLFREGQRIVKASGYVPEE